MPRTDKSCVLKKKCVQLRENLIKFLPCAKHWVIKLRETKSRKTSYWVSEVPQPTRTQKCAGHGCSPPGYRAASEEPSSFDWATYKWGYLSLPLMISGGTLVREGTYSVYDETMGPHGYQSLVIARKDH